jgi:hypothetical protein
LIKLVSASEIMDLNLPHHIILESAIKCCLYLQ